MQFFNLLSRIFLFKIVELRIFSAQRGELGFRPFAPSPPTPLRVSVLGLVYS